MLCNEGECKECNHCNHEPGHCKQCNCGENDRVQIKGKPFFTSHTYGGGGYGYISKKGGNYNEEK